MDRTSNAVAHKRKTVSRTQTARRPSALVSKHCGCQLIGQSVVGHDCTGTGSKHFQRDIPIIRVGTHGSCNAVQIRLFTYSSVYHQGRDARSVRPNEDPVNQP